MWVDTTQTTSNSSGIDIEITAISEHEVLGWTIFDGQEALQFATVTRYTLAGAGNQLGQAISLEGSGVRHERHFVSASGSYLGGTSADTSHTNALVPEMGLTIPITQTRADSLGITTP